MLLKLATIAPWFGRLDLCICPLALAVLPDKDNPLVLPCFSSYPSFFLTAWSTGSQWVASLLDGCSDVRDMTSHRGTSAMRQGKLPIYIQAVSASIAD